MRSGLAALLFLFSAIIPPQGYSQNIFRFQHLGSEDGLSQNTANSILFDSKGFMWIGTWNGLNRYDGNEFKIFRSHTYKEDNFTNNRVSRLWEDKKGFIWIETYDGYYHFFNPVTELFTTVPLYKGTNIRNGGMQCFLQYSDEIIFLGSSVSGVFMLKYDYGKTTYSVKQLPEKESSSLLSSNIRFIHQDILDNVWIGTSQGLGFIPADEMNKSDPAIQGLHTVYSFTSMCEAGNDLFFGTEKDGIIRHNIKTGQVRQMTGQNTPGLTGNSISCLYVSKNIKIITGLSAKGVLVTDSTCKNWTKVPFHGKTLSNVYEDRQGQAWLTSVEFGVTRLDLETLETAYYQLTPEDFRSLTDLERPHFFEDSRNNLWLGLHGSGLGLFHRDSDRFGFFRNDPKNSNSISSNFVHWITEDKTGQIWLGTGQVLGGIEKVIPENPAFEHFLLKRDRTDILDNVARAVCEDNNRFLWAGTKDGKLHLLDSSLNRIRVYNSLPLDNGKKTKSNIYSIFNDDKGYLWLGSKGDGLFISTKPLMLTGKNYENILFRNYSYSSENPAAIGNNNLYSICQDTDGNVWIGTYGNGLDLVKRLPSGELVFTRINQQNSNLSSNLVRNLLVDSGGNLWVATTFGLNRIIKSDIEKENFTFKVYLKNPSDPSSLSYNDVVHIFEDSKARLWFGTFGGGLDLLENTGEPDEYFRHYPVENILANGIIYGILEDTEGNIWLSSENGLIRFDPLKESNEIYNSYNGLGFNNFSENTCCIRKDGSLVFGGFLGLEIIRPQKLVVNPVESRIELTNFLLFNKEVPISQNDSPLKKSISFSDEIRLKFQQSSFTIVFSALDFQDPGKIQYSYILENFEDSWNNVGNQHRAVYTNLSPGRYIFRVKYILRDGKTESGERVLRIRILPPWYKTIPAYLFYLMMISIIGVSIYKTATRLNRYRNELIIEKKINELKLQFFTNISHEIRTPLTLIISPIEDMLTNRHLSDSGRIQLEIMLKNARRMLHLTNQLLDFRKVQNNKMILKIKELDIVTFTKEIFESFIPLAKHKGISYNFHTAEPDCMIFADPGKVDIIIYNVISNAIKFTKPGKNVSVSIESSDSSGWIDIAVADEGPGIPQKNLSDIFTRYTILSNQELAGTGIGLSLSYELAKLHKGDIIINSTLGEGSTFIFRLLKGIDHFSESDMSDMSTDGGPGIKYIHTGNLLLEDDEDMEVELWDTDPSDKDLMLIVEDNQEILNYICQSLKSVYRCIGAKNGNEGLHLARTINPDIIITDIRMPEMDGLDLTARLKGEFNTSHIPVIMLTAKTDINDQIQGIEKGAEAYIVKPFNMEYLKTVAKNLLSQRTNIIAHYTSLNAPGSDTLKIGSKDEEFLNKLIGFIDKNYSETITIESLSDHCNVSRTILYNKIKGLTGLSPHEFLRRKKLNIAAKLLNNGYNVSEAAYKTGFQDTKYFSRLFKSQFGYSPSKHEAGRKV